MMFVVWCLFDVCLVSAVCYSVLLLVVRCLCVACVLFVRLLACLLGGFRVGWLDGWMHVVLCFVVCCLLFDVCLMFVHVVCLFVCVFGVLLVLLLLSVVCCLLFDVCYLLIGVW